MLKDITIGQYYPGDTLIHRMDPRVKLLATIAYIVCIFLFRGVIGLAYDWDKIHSSALSSINKALILNIGGILLVMVVVLAVLYRRSVRPAVKMQKALDWVMVMVTDVVYGDSVLLSTDHSALRHLPYSRLRQGVYDMPGVMSRKKQLLPEVLHALSTDF